MSQQTSIWLPEAASTIAGDVDALFYFILITSVIFFVGVVTTMVIFAWRFRRRSPDDRPEPVHENKLVEASWIVIPSILVAVVFIWGFKLFLELGIAPPNSYEVNVTARKWSWSFSYPNGAISTDLHVPVNRPIKLRMSSDDVIHSFFVPAFRVKADVLQGRYSYVWFEATKKDTFIIACAEYCGTSHSDMYARVITHSQDDFENWLVESLPDDNLTPAQRGERLYEQWGCIGCHTLDGTTPMGPTFLGLAGSTRNFADGTSAVADDNYLRTSILNPGLQIIEGWDDIMPGQYAANLSSEEIDALVAFINEQQ
ncbi:MAG: cytochrome c oxidase subunit II [Rhodothermaceae bacterium]|nr:cytochrome c oxidase subunit II [Rhodothermaceae bacterium]MXZ58278.1 cytochrome c oxidase subunit II [Rhodothermaceae bacterium]MYB92039.1 cytochrome c oxidase subunit II [Rhodothermaceae bacterium]MYD67964.1 cytochrome c oxidase subunit II [Rhodothermaceae bacterium]MYG44083.1 cytochrome c oxidase subunit II [Rhodothermaceae bacterium]